MNKKWYTADQHFWHWNIINYCKRQDPATGQVFNTVERMNELLVERYNECVDTNDEVYFLGDVCFSTHKAIVLLEQMNGRKHLIAGNHDARSLAKWSGWETTSNYKEIKDQGRKVILCHYPIWSWNGMHKGAVHGSTHLHGHCHGTLKIPQGYRIADIGVDSWQYRPMTLDKIESAMQILGLWNSEIRDREHFADSRRSWEDG